MARYLALQGTVPQSRDEGTHPAVFPEGGMAVCGSGHAQGHHRKPRWSEREHLGGGAAEEDHED